MESYVEPYVLIIFVVVGLLIGYLKIRKDLRLGVERSRLDRIAIPLVTTILGAGAGACLLYLMSLFGGV